MKFIRALLVFGVLGVGIGGFMYLKSTKPKAERKPIENLGTLVEVIDVERGSHAVHIPAQGTVQASQQVNLSPEVGGRIIWRHAQLVPGGMVKKGQALVRLDPKSYELAAAQQRAQVDRARMDLQLEKGRGDVAAREWEILRKEKDSMLRPEDSALALRDPQLRNAKVGVTAAESALASAQLQVRRTALKAPFNAFVQSAMADPGQLVSAQSRIATLVGTDAFWVQVSVPMENLAWLSIPRPGADTATGAVASVRQDVGAVEITREGRVVRLLGDLDPVGRMARVLVEIEDPFNLKASSKEKHVAAGNQLPLLVGAFVDVEIDAGTIDNAVEIPRKAVRDGERVFVYADDRSLQIRPIQVAWRNTNTVLVQKGLEPGDKVIISRISAPVEGMLLRLPQVAAPADAKPEAAAPAEPEAANPPTEAEAEAEAAQ